jgi:hypothetical protein
MGLGVALVIPRKREAIVAPKDNNWPARAIEGLDGLRTKPARDRDKITLGGTRSIALVADRVLDITLNDGAETLEVATVHDSSVPAASAVRVTGGVIRLPRASGTLASRPRSRWRRRPRGKALGPATHPRRRPSSPGAIECLPGNAQQKARSGCR